MPHRWDPQRDDMFLPNLIYLHLISLTLTTPPPSFSIFFLLLNKMYQFFGINI